MRSLLPFAAACLVAVLSGCSSPDVPSNAAETADQAVPEGIETAVATQTESIPLGTVPGTITLPPEARVAVTAPFAGATVRVFVIEGQAVRRGQTLAVIRAAEPVRIRGELSRAQAALRLAEARAKRMQQLADEGIIAAARADEAQAELSQARASHIESSRMAALAGAGADGTMTLTAPIAGHVQHVGVETGGPVDGMAAPFVIENADAYRIDLQLPERIARDVRPGMLVAVSLPARGDGTTVRVEGAILSVAPSIDPETRSVMAKASIASVPGLVAGQNVSVTISGTSAQGGVAVPVSAVTRIGNDDHVFIQHGKSFEPRKVTVAAVSGGKAVIAEGLKAGETVASGSVAELKAMNMGGASASHDH